MIIPTKKHFYRYLMFKDPGYFSTGTLTNCCINLSFKFQGKAERCRPRPNFKFHSGLDRDRDSYVFKTARPNFKFHSGLDRDWDLYVFKTARPNFKFHSGLDSDRDSDSYVLKTARHNFKFHSGLDRDRETERQRVRFLCFKDSETQF